MTVQGKPVLRIVSYEPKDSRATLFFVFQGKVDYAEAEDTPTFEEWTELQWSNWIHPPWYSGL